MTRVYSFEIRHPDGDIYRIRGIGNTKKVARGRAAYRFQKIHGVDGNPEPANRGRFVPEKDRGPEGI